MTVQPLRVAIAGAGMIAELHRRAAILAGAEVVGVLASSPARSRAVADEWGVGAFDTIDDVVAAGIDVLHIATPNATHAPYCRAALAAGLHVICEKPLGVTLDEANGLDEAAVAVGVVATVPFVYRYHPLVREIRSRRESGELGNLLLMHGSYLQDWMLQPDVSGWRVDPAHGGRSRAFADIGSHWCDLVEWVSGERFAELTAQTAIAHSQRPVAGGASFTGVADTTRMREVSTEDCAALLFRTDSGVLASCTVSQVSAGRKNRLWFELDGSEASAVFDQENPETVWLGGDVESRTIVRGAASESAEQRRLSYLPPGHAQGYADCFAAFVADTYAAIGGARPIGLPTFADGRRAAQIVDAMLRSAESRSWEPIATGG